MDDGPALALQQVIVATLRADPALAGLVSGRVYDEAPADVAFPYVRLGNVDPQADRIGCYTDDRIRFSIECYSRPPSGRVEAGRIGFSVRRALDGAQLDPAGYTLDWLDYLTQTTTRAPDGASYVATVAFEAAMAPAA